MRGIRQTYPFSRPALNAPGDTLHLPVVIVGAGPIGMAMGLELDRLGVRNVILDDDNKVSIGSRAICWSKRSLEILDRVGCGERMLGKGVRWNVGKVFYGSRREPVYEFNMLEEEDQQFPGFVNLQQYYVEEYLLERIQNREHTQVHWENEVIAAEQNLDGVVATVRTPDGGDYRIACDFLIAADGCQSPLRQMLGIDFEGEVFQDHFLIADIRMKADFPSERWFWFDPEFNRGQSALLHKQPDDIWRLDFQLGWDIDRNREMEPERVRRRIRAMLGDHVEFEIEWVSIYTFQCRRLDHFVHDRIVFVGDAAHLVSPFGARGANSGLQDIDNLGWKLALVLDGRAPRKILESYDEERIEAARENILNSTRATDFITPKSDISRAFRNAVLELSRDHGFARQFVNSGRLSVPCTLETSALNTPDAESFDCRLVLGAPCTDAPVKIHGENSWLLKALGSGFTGIYFGEEVAPAAEAASELERDSIPVRTLVVGKELTDHTGLLRKRLDGQPGTYCLFRPDQHLVARWRRFDAARIRQAVARATGQMKPENPE